MAIILIGMDHVSNKVTTHFQQCKIKNISTYYECKKPCLHDA